MSPFYYLLKQTTVIWNQVQPDLYQDNKEITPI